MNRNLDGIYFRVKREDKWQNVCFSDLTEKEREELFEGENQKSALWWRTVAYRLADVLKEVGDRFDIYRGD